MTTADHWNTGEFTCTILKSINLTPCKILLFVHITKYIKNKWTLFLCQQTDNAGPLWCKEPIPFLLPTTLSPTQRIFSSSVSEQTIHYNKKHHSHSLTYMCNYRNTHCFTQLKLWMNEWKCEDFKCVWKPTESRLCLTHYVNKSSRWVK